MISPSLLALGVIFLAEIGDKSQLVCMTLASRHKAKPVTLGAVAAFAMLNLLAVSLGGGLTQLIPETYLTLLAAALFAGFGLHSLFSHDDDDDEVDEVRTGKGIFLTTFMMIFLAELGDKTQIAVVTLSTAHSPVAIWIGATLALSVTSLLGVFAGRRWLAKLNINLLHKLSGVFFLVLAGLMVLEMF